jgi:hypothetical protein
VDRANLSCRFGGVNFRVHAAPVPVGSPAPDTEAAVVLFGALPSIPFSFQGLATPFWLIEPKRGTMAMLHVGRPA